MWKTHRRGKNEDKTQVHPHTQIIRTLPLPFASVLWSVANTAYNGSHKNRQPVCTSSTKSCTHEGKCSPYLAGKALSKNALHSGITLGGYRQSRPVLPCVTGKRQRLIVHYIWWSQLTAALDQFSALPECLSIEFCASLATLDSSCTSESEILA